MQIIFIKKKLLEAIIGYEGLLLVTWSYITVYKQTTVIKKKQLLETIYSGGQKKQTVKKTKPFFLLLPLILMKFQWLEHT